MWISINKPCAALFMLTLCACRPAVRSAAPPPSASVQVRWLGGPTALLTYGGLRVLTDPMLGPRGEHAFVLAKHPSSGVPDAAIARYTTPVAFSFEALDAILISHTHPDHVDARARETLPKHLPLVVAAAGVEAMRSAGFTDVRALDWGQALTLSHGSTTLRVTAEPAHHAHDASLDQHLGRGNGYVLDWSSPSGTYRAYWTGDAVLSDESRTLTERAGPIDLLLPHMGGVGGDGGLGLRTMNAEELLGLVARVQPRAVVPIHHTTFAHYREPIEALEQRAAESGLSHLFRFLREGESVELRAAGR
jgi:L-ascorbate metabolism protein UlaG (beta-lactamase superfamily)